MKKGVCSYGQTHENLTCQIQAENIYHFRCYDVTEVLNYFHERSRYLISTCKFLSPRDKKYDMAHVYHVLEREFFRVFLTKKGCVLMEKHMRKREREMFNTGAFILLGLNMEIFADAVLNSKKSYEEVFELSHYCTYMLKHSFK